MHRSARRGIKDTVAHAATSMYVSSNASEMVVLVHLAICAYHFIYLNAK